MPREQQRVLRGVEEAAIFLQLRESKHRREILGRDRDPLAQDAVHLIQLVEMLRIVERRDGVEQPRPG